ncbi:MAG: endonuclease domain-containing protein, partial [Acidimicrobiales bacterium]
SSLEDLFYEVVTDAGLERPDKQVKLGTDEAFTGRVDFVYRAAKLVVEIDSAWHDGPDDRERDRWRDNDLHGEGWRVLRFRYRDLVTHPERVVRAIRTALRAAVA